MKRQLRIVVLVALLLSLNGTAWGDFYVIPTAPSFVGTRITSLPYPITKSGFYYLAGNLSSTEHGIIISASDVTIDLAGFTLTGNGGNSIGVSIIDNNPTNVEVRNGTVRGFSFGIGATDSAAAVRILNIRAESNTASGIVCWAAGSLIMGCYAGNNINGFDLTGSCNILNNVAINNSGTGFLMNNDPFQLVDRNVASNNGVDWDYLTDCTKGLNTPPPITAAAAAATVQKAPGSKRGALKFVK